MDESGLLLRLNAIPGPYASATALAAALRQRSISSVELLELTLARIERFDGKVNAVVARDDANARLAALEADRALARGVRLPLLGVPVTVKESLDVAGLPTTCGIRDRAQSKAQSDAPAVAALKLAGAIVIGKTNVPEANGDIQTYNSLFGVTRNPWNLALSPGGSSGGSAAALAAGYVSLEVGSDIGGSTRIPAHFCGVFAHKPSYGIVTTRGNGVASSNQAERDLVCIGPLARSTADLVLGLDVLTTSDDLQHKAWRLSLPPSRHKRMGDFRVLLLDTHPLLSPSASATTAMDGVRLALVEEGVKVASSTDLLPDLVASHKVYQTLLIGSSLANRTQASLDEAAVAISRLSADDDSFQAVRVRAGLLSHREWLIANEARMRLRLEWERLFKSFDVVVTPVSVSPAFAHDHSLPRDARVVTADGHAIPYLDLFVWIGLASVAGLPATSVPVGLHNGLPVGAQILGPYLEDKTCLAFAGLLEQTLGGFRIPPGY